MAQPISFVPAKPGEHVAALPPEDDFPMSAPFPTTPHPVAVPAAEVKAPAAAAAVQNAPTSQPPIAPVVVPATPPVTQKKVAPMPEPPRTPLAQTTVTLPKAPALIPPQDKKTQARKVVRTIAKILGILVAIALLAVAGLYYWGYRISQGSDIGPDSVSPLSE